MKLVVRFIGSEYHSSSMMGPYSNAEPYLTLFNKCWSGYYMACHVKKRWYMDWREVAIR